MASGPRYALPPPDKTPMRLGVANLILSIVILAILGLWEVRHQQAQKEAREAQREIQRQYQEMQRNLRLWENVAPSPGG